jgi:quinol monooxygenase YgiN/mannose-6-phosphate isomerase-like protein (cupin superfamily)
MAGVGRYMKFTAQPGRADELADKLLEAAASLENTAGCELYVINRDTGDLDVVWVTELWLSQETLDASLEQLRSTEEGQARVTELQALLAGPPERIDVTPVGGVGYLADKAGYTHLNLDEDVEDMAPRFGLGEMGESRFANRALGAARTGLSHQRLRPGVRQAFGHRHQHAEEVVVVLDGSGKVKIDDELREIRPRDAIRFAPDSTRAFEAGPDGLELLVVSAKHPGDAIMDRTFWPAETEAQ